MNEQDYIVNAFTKEGDQTNLEVNHLDVSCLTSKENNFELDSEGNLIVKSITTTKKISPNQDVIDLIYPVGSVYISVLDRNPEIYLGGEWEPLKDRFLLGAGDTYQNGTVGGESTHVLTIAEIPSHSHALGITGNGGGIISGWVVDSTAVNRTNVNLVNTANMGSSKEHNNMPPYLTVYMWKRIA